MEILIRNKSKLEVIDETINALESLYPDYLTYCKQEITKLRQVSKPGFCDEKGREVRVTMKIPTILFMFLQQVIPDFGKTADDIALLTNRIKELDAHIPLHTDRTSLLVPKVFKARINNLMTEEDAANARKEIAELEGQSS